MAALQVITLGRTFVLGMDSNNFKACCQAFALAQLDIPAV